MTGGGEVCDRCAILVAAGEIALAVGLSDEDAPREVVLMDAKEARRLAGALSDAAKYLTGAPPPRRPAHKRR